MRYREVVWLLLFTFYSIIAQAQIYSIKGSIIDRQSREKIPYAAAVIWNTTKGETTDSAGRFVISGVRPGMYRLEISNVGYKKYLSPEFQITSFDQSFIIELEPDNITIQDIVVKSSPFVKTSESPVSLSVIGLKEIEKSPGANRDISKVVSTLPGVGNSVGGYRNDLLVRGGGPSENRFFLDGVEIPNINHFSTQGASGGPVGIIDADLIREVNFHSGAFPANRGNALSSVMDFKLKDGHIDKNVFRATVGASEVAFSANGHLSDKTTYLFSVRRSYLQFLFGILDLPFLPAFTDMQFKVKTKLSDNHEITILGLGAIDNMKLNTDMDTTDDSKRYLLGYLPEINQKTYTLGAVYKHTQGNHTQNIVLSNSFLNNRNTKFFNNDESRPENRSLDINSDEIEYHLRAENTSWFGRFRVNAGANVDYSIFRNNTFQKIFIETPRELNYSTNLGMFRWGVFGSAGYESNNRKLNVSLGLRVDANNTSSAMNNMLEQFSPRAALSYNITGNFFINGSAGRFYQLPAYTTIGYKDNSGNLKNIDEGITYIRSDQFVIGAEYRISNTSRITLEGFYKTYNQSPVSVIDSIPLASKGTDYGTTGAEEVRSTGKGRSYGLEVMYRLAGLKRTSLIASYTLFRSEFTDPRKGGYIPSAWDNTHLLTIVAGYSLPRNWDIGAKFRFAGGTPYTPYDLNKSSLVVAWDASSRPYYDYSQYNSGRLGTFSQLDLRIDKAFYFKGWMLGFYFDIQNALGIKYLNQDIYISTGKIDPSTAMLPVGEQRYLMKTISNKDGTVLPTIGIMIEF